MTETDDIREAARRMAGIYNLHASVGAFGTWIAVRLSDGGSDGVLYDTRDDAVSHQLWPEYRFYMKIQPFPMSAEDAEGCLDFNRKAFNAGHKVIGPEYPDAIMPLEYGRL